MWFEKRAGGDVTQDQPTDETLELSPELNSLARQLSDEADRLAHCYTADSTDRFTATAAAATRRDWRGLKRLGMLAGVCAASVLTMFVGWQTIKHFNHSDTVVEDHPLTVEQSSQVAQRNDTGGFGGHSAEVIGDSDNVLKGLSGAEQEAVLDLIESHAMHKSSLSI
jgi:hypothetical protein